MIDPPRLIAFYRRCRLEDQRGFYDDRSREFGSAAGQLATVSAVVLGLTTVTSILAGVEWGGTTTFAILAIALPALSTALAGYGALYAFEQQRKLYLDAVRALSKAGREEPAEPAAYAEAVEEILAREQAQWGQFVGEIKPTGPGA
jgi:hypothetical protein